MSVTLQSFIEFFVLFENAITKDSAPGLMYDVPRNADHLLGLFQGYSNCHFEVFDVDLSDVEDERLYSYRPHEITSIVLNFGSRAEIYVNTMLDSRGEPLINYCKRRFFAIKEAYHVILRDDFIRRGVSHPDSSDPEKLQSAIEKMVYLPFSILDLDDPKYPDAERVEHAAELLSLVTFYPIEAIARDREEFLRDVGVTTFEHPKAMVASTRGYAEIYKVPQRYVDIAFRWNYFPQLLEMYKKAKANLAL